MSSTLLPNLATRHQRDGGIIDSEADTSGGVLEKAQEGREVGADAERKEVDTSDTLKGDIDDDDDLCTLSLTEVSPRDSTLIQAHSAGDLGEIHDWAEIKDATAAGGSPHDDIGNEGAQDIGARGAQDIGSKGVAVLQENNRDKKDVLLVHKNAKAETTFHDTEFDSTQPICGVPDKEHHHTPTSSTPLPPEVTRPSSDTVDSSRVAQQALPLLQESAIQRPPVPPLASAIQYSREDICRVVRQEIAPILQVRLILLAFIKLWAIIYSL